jgi:hypothetical protein
VRSAKWILIAFVVLIVAYGIRAYTVNEQQRTICTEINTLKAVIRPKPFDEEHTKTLLRDLGVNPDSPVGEKLLREGREQREKDRAELAPSGC